MQTFQQFLVEQDTTQNIATQIQKVQPQQAANVIKQLGAQNIDDLIQKLLANDKVRKVFALVKQAQQKQAQQKQEHVELDEGIMAGVGKAVGWVVEKSLKSIYYTIVHVFGGFGEAEGVSGKVRFAGALLLTFLLAPYLLATGAPLAAVVGLPLGWSATWWFLSWLGDTVLKPFLQYAG